MKPLFRKRAAEPREATPDNGPTKGPTDADLSAAYQRGRKDERARHRRSPLIAVALVAVALVGGASLVLAAREGSFREGGAVLDAGVGVAAREAVPTLKRGAHKAGEELRKVQDNLSSDTPG
ncbi:MAG: hypothetical protein GC145_16395 [Caulobacter sp.]|nr:hypothetical protein [Caulobacter sp.]